MPTHFQAGQRSQAEFPFYTDHLGGTESPTPTRRGVGSNSLSGWPKGVRLSSHYTGTIREGQSVPRLSPEKRDIVHVIKENNTITKQNKEFVLVVACILFSLSLSLSLSLVKFLVFLSLPFSLVNFTPNRIVSYSVPVSLSGV